MNLQPIATRGSSLSLAIAHWVDVEDANEPTTVEALVVIQTNDDSLLRDAVTFDFGDIDAAFEELDTRYLIGEAAGNKVWSEVAQSYAAMNRHEMPSTMADWETVDNRVRETFQGGELSAYTRSAWDLIPDVSIRVETVHRLTSFGAVCTHVAYGTSNDGFEAEWRMVVILMVHANSPNRCELFNETDLDAALARFGEL